MKIGMVTSWNSKCGISEYAGRLVSGLRSDNSIHVKVCANYLDSEYRAFDQIDEPFVKRLFHTPFMTKCSTADVNGMAEYLNECDLIHFQFNTALYHPSWFQMLLNSLNKPVIFTMHDSGMWAGINFNKVKRFISHSRMGCTTDLIPMGVQFQDGLLENVTTDLCSFGLGRNNDDWVREAIKDTNISYRTSYGNSKWLNEFDLYKFLGSSKIISLLYPETGAEVSSSALIFAMGVQKPILISPTAWFSDFINYPGLYICRDIKDAKENINYLLDINNIEEINNDLKERKRMLTEDGRTFDKFIERHINVYKTLI